MKENSKCYMLNYLKHEVMKYIIIMCNIRRAHNIYIMKRIISTNGKEKNNYTI